MKALSRDSVQNGPPDANPKDDRAFGMYRRFAWGLLLYNFVVIALGALVRATGSGDGCGSHWPNCDGELIPTNPSVQKLIEYTHRIFSVVDGPLVLALAVGAFYLFPRKHPVRAAALATVFLTGVEG